MWANDVLRGTMGMIYRRLDVYFSGAEECSIYPKRLAFEAQRMLEDIRYFSGYVGEHG